MQKRATSAEKDLAAVRAEAMALQQAARGGAGDADAEARDQETAAKLERLQKVRGADWTQSMWSATYEGGWWCTRRSPTPTMDFE